MGGIFGGFLLGLAYIALIGRGRAWREPGFRLKVLLLMFVAAMGFDGLNAFLFDLRLPHLYEPVLAIRLATGLLTGLATAIFMVPTVNSTLWQTGLDASPIASGKALVGGLAIEGIYFAAALSGYPLLFYPVSVIAVLGVPVLMMALAVVIVASITKQTNRAANWAKIAPLLFASFGLVILALALVSTVRFLLFGPGPMDFPMIG